MTDNGRTAGDPTDPTNNHDIVEAALRRMPRELALQSLDDMRRWHTRHKSVRAAQACGARVAPLYRRPLSEQLLEEATRRARSDDRTWTVWDAYAAKVRGMEAQA